MLQPTKAPLPLALSGENEGAYNLRAFQRSNGVFAHLDKNNIRLTGRSAIEACDVYWENKAFKHVKKYSDGSATLSHLFNQGVVSAQTFMSEPQFREQLLGKLPAMYRWGAAADVIRTSDYEIAYAIITKSAGSFNLPFFSRVSLKNAATLLKSFGYRVTLSQVVTT